MLQVLQKESHDRVGNVTLLFVKASSQDCLHKDSLNCLLLLVLMVTTGFHPVPNPAPRLCSSTSTLQSAKEWRTPDEPHERRCAVMVQRN